MRSFRLSCFNTHVLAVWCALLLAGCGGGGGDSTPAPATPPPPPPPTITLAALPTGALYRTVPLSATAAATAGITRVEFIIDGTAIATVTAAPYSTNWDTSAVSDGAHTVAARVTDGANVSVTTATVNAAVNNHPVIAVTLAPSETLPLPVSTATGTGEFTVNLIDGAVTGGVTTSGITATMAHIHDGFAGAAGPVIIPFVQSGTDANRWNAQTGALLTADQIDGLLAGRLYVNVHSAAYPAGEIRGQLKPENIKVVFAAMSGANMVPAVTTAAAGTAVATIDTRVHTATMNIVSTGVDDATSAHVHKAAAGASTAAALLTLTKDSVALGRWSVQLQPSYRGRSHGFRCQRLVRRRAHPGQCQR